MEEGKSPKGGDRDASILWSLETAPLPARVKEVLVGSILDGKFPAGRLPREEELAAQLGVSRGTVRDALRSLEEEGLVSRRPGIGTLINEHIARARITLNRVVGFYQLIRDAGFEPTIARTEVEQAPAPADFTSRLSLEPEAELVEIDRLFLADGQPAIHVVERLLPERLRAPIDGIRVEESIFDFADAHCTTAIDHTTVEVIPTTATDGTADLLPVEPGDPLLRLIETHYDSGGIPFMVSDIHVVDRFIRFTLVRRRY